MKRQIDAVKDKLWDMLNKAESYGDSENEAIAEKYTDVAVSLEEAIQALIDACERLNDC